MLIKKEEVRNRWKEYSEDLLVQNDNKEAKIIEEWSEVGVVME